MFAIPSATFGHITLRKATLLKFRVVTVNFSGVQILRVFTVPKVKMGTEDPESEVQWKIPYMKDSIYKYCNFPKFSDRQVWANSADPDQTAPRGAV